MGMGLLGTLAGAGEGLSAVGKQMMDRADKSALQQEHFDFLEKKQIAAEKRAQELKDGMRNQFVSTMDGMRNAKLGENAANLDQAAEIYRSSDGLSDTERQSGLQGVEQARVRLGKLTPEEVGMAGLKTGNLEAKDYINATSRVESTSDKLANAVLLKQLGIDATAKNVQTKEDGKNERLDKSIDSKEGIAGDKIESQEKIAATKGGETLAQQVHNKEIDAARRIVASLSPIDIKKKTAKFTDTGRDNPDYDAGLATRVRIAAKRKYGSDDWFDSQSGNVGETASTPSTGISDRFTTDAAMQGFKLGKQTDKGTEVFNSSGKLVGHYR